MRSLVYPHRLFSLVTVSALILQLMPLALPAPGQIVTSLAKQTFYGTLPFASGHAGLGMANPVALTTRDKESASAAGVELAPPAAVQNGLPGQTVTYTLALTNTAGLTDSFHLTPAIAGEPWATTVAPTHTTTLMPGGTIPLTVSVFISPTALAGEQSVAVVTATSVTSPTVSASSRLTTTAVFTGVPHHITLVSVPTLLPVSSGSTLTATVYDGLNMLVADQVITFTTSDPLGGGTSLPLTATTDVQGQATAVISSTLAGVKQITATAYNMVAASTEVTFYDNLLTIVKSADPPHGPPDAALNFTVTYTNNVPITLTGVTITDWLPADTSALTDTSGLPVVTSTGRLTWTVSSLPPDSTASFVLRLRYDGTACRVTLTNTVAITSTLPDPTPGNNQAEASYRVDCDVDLVVIKNDGTGSLNPFRAPPRAGKQAAVNRLLQTGRGKAALAATQGPIYEGDTLTYTIAVINAGSYTATHVVLTETLPTYTDYADGGWTHVSDQTYTRTAVVGEVYYFVVRVHDILPDGVDHLANLVCGGSDDPDVDPSDNCSYVTTPVYRRPLRVLKSGPACVSPGDWFVYHVTYQNTTTSTTFYDVSLADTLPLSVSYSGGLAWNCASGVCSQTIAAIPPGTGDTLLLPVQLDAAFPYTLQTSITNIVEIQGGGHSELATPIDTGPDLLVIKNDDVETLSLAQQLEWNHITRRLFGSQQHTFPQVAAHRTSASPGKYITYTILYLNAGLGLATGVVLTETLPEHTSYFGGGWTHAGGQQYTMTIGSLASGQGSQVQFIVQLNDSLPVGLDRVTNRVEIGGEQPECDLSNNSSTRETPVQTDLKLYVANRDSGTVEVFNTTTFDYITTIPVGGSPFGMAAHDNLLFVANQNSLQVIDTSDDTLVGSTLVGNHPIHVAAHEGYVYTANHGDGEGITVVEASEPYNVVGRLRPNRELAYDFGFFGITVDDNRDLIYATKRDFGSLGLWSLTPPGSALLLGYVFPTDEGQREKPSSIVYNSHTDRVYVTFGLIDELWVFDPDGWELLERIPTGRQDPADPGCGGHGLAALGQCVFVSNYLDQSVTAVLDGRCADYWTPSPVSSPAGPYRLYLPLALKYFGQGIRTISLRGRPKGMIGAGNLLFVTLPLEDRVAIINTETFTVTTEISVLGDYPHTVILAGGN